MDTTFEHTLPTGNAVTFTLTVEDTESPRAIVGYPADLDLSRFASDVAYPVAAIETAMSAACGRAVEFARCTSNGCDADSWEVWTFRDAETTVPVVSYEITLCDPPAGGACLGERILFSTRERAEDALTRLAVSLECDADDLMVVERAEAPDAGF